MSKEKFSVTRMRTAEQARVEASFLRDQAAHAMTCLSVETYEQRTARKARLEAAAARLEAEVLATDVDGPNGS